MEIQSITYLTPQDFILESNQQIIFQTVQNYRGQFGLRSAPMLSQFSDPTPMTPVSVDTSGSIGSGDSHPELSDLDSLMDLVILSN